MTEREFYEKKYENMLTKHRTGASYIKYEAKEGERRFKLMLFRPKSRKIWRTLFFPDDAQRTKAIVEFLASIEYEACQKKTREDDRRSKVLEFKAGLKEGDLFAYTWGYDQTNVNFYKLEKKKQATAVLVEIGKKKVPSSDLGMAAMVVPDPDTIVSQGVVKKYGPGHFDMPHGTLRKTEPDQKHYVSWCH